MSWLYQPLLPGGAQQQSNVAYTLAVTPATIAVTGQDVTLSLLTTQPLSTGGASYLTQEEYEAAQARYRKLENARKDIKRRERAKWDRVMGRVEEATPEPQEASSTVRTAKTPTIAPIPSVASPSEKLASIAQEMEKLRETIAAHQAAQAEEDEIETLLMLVA